jgi:ribonuclease-3
VTEKIRLTAPQAAFSRRLGHEFADPSLLRTALTHRSHSSPHNERLEFLGDSILNCIVAHLLFERFLQLPEGDLSRLRANLVKKDTLHELALGLDLGEQLRLGEGELKSGGHTRPSILADALEALFGAVYLDAGFDRAKAVVGNLFTAKLDAIAPDQPIKDPKTRLQEYLQARRQPLPVYTLAATDGQAHLQQFRVLCEVVSAALQTEGQGSSRRAAEQEAASRALEKLKA